MQQSVVYWRTDGACNGEFLDEMEAMHGGSSPGLIHPTFTQHSPLMLAHHCHQAVLVSITSVLQWFLCPSITLVMQTWSMMNNTEQLSYILQNYYYCSSSWIAIILMNDHRNSLLSMFEYPKIWLISLLLVVLLVPLLYPLYPPFYHYFTSHGFAFCGNFIIFMTVWIQRCKNDTKLL